MMNFENNNEQRQDTPRPLELAGWTWRILFEHQKLFVTVNHNGDHILEVFVTEMLSNGIGLLTSKMLQSGCFSVREVAGSLRKISGTNTVRFNDKILNSPEQVVAECLLIAQSRLDDIRQANKSQK